MQNSPKRVKQFLRLPPCGGSGLKFMEMGALLSADGLPPCGGSGLKFHKEIRINKYGKVSLHAEGVD